MKNNIKQIVTILFSLPAFLPPYREGRGGSWSRVGLLLVLLMMAMSPQNVWADEVTITALRGNPNSDGEGYAKLFDGDATTKWCSSSDDEDDCYVIFKLSQSKAITGYTLVDAEDTNKYYGRHWVAWTIYGANFSSDDDATKDATGWTQVDSRSNQSYNSESNETAFTVSNANAYKYYKVVINKVGVSYDAIEDEEGVLIEENAMQQMAEMQFTYKAAANAEQNSKPDIMVTKVTALGVKENVGFKVQNSNEWLKADAEGKWVLTSTDTPVQGAIGEKDYSGFFFNAEGTAHSNGYCVYSIGNTLTDINDPANGIVVDPSTTGGPLLAPRRAVVTDIDYFVIKGNGDLYVLIYNGQVYGTSAVENATKFEVYQLAYADHDFTAHPEVANTCTTNGNSAYYYCSICGKYFSDEAGTKEIAANSWVIPATGHAFTADGVCTKCGERCEFEVAITKANASEAALSKDAASLITLEYNNAAPKVTLTYGENDANAASLNFDHLTRYDFTLSPGKTIGTGEGTLDGDLVSHAKRRNTSAAPEEPTLNGPALVVGTATAYTTYPLDAQHTSIKLFMTDDGDYVVNGTKVEGTVTSVYFFETHYYLDGENGFCHRCDAYQPATTVYKEGSTTEVDHYAISNAGQLYWFADKVNNDNASYGTANAKLTKDIVVNEGTFDDEGNWSKGATPRTWTPIGFDKDFKGKFDGCGHTVSGLYCKSNRYASFFGQCNKAEIRYVGVEKSYFEAGESAGVAYYASISSISDCYFSGTMRGTYGFHYCVAYLQGSELINCWMEAKYKYGYVNYLPALCKSVQTGTKDGVETKSLIRNCYTNARAISLYNYDNEVCDIEEVYYQINDFDSGRITWELNRVRNADGTWKAGPTDGSQTWYQKLATEGGDNYPVFAKAEDGSNTVYTYNNYYCDGSVKEFGGYSNDKNAGTTAPHTFNNHTLSASADEKGLYSYVCDRSCNATQDGVKVIKNYAPNAEGDAKNLVLTVANGNYSTTEAVTLTDNNQFAGVDVWFNTPQAPTYTRTMTSEWGTMVLPFYFDADDVEGYAFYTVSSYDATTGILSVSRARGILDPCTMVLVRKTTDEPLSIVSTDPVLHTLMVPDYTSDGSIKMTGSYEVLNLTSGYIIYKDAFWSVESLLKDYNNVTSVKMAPFRFYLTPDENAGAKLQIMVEEETTGLRDVQFDNLQGTIDGKYLENGRIVILRNGKKYNVAGQRVDGRASLSIPERKQGQTKFNVNGQVIK